MRKILTAIALVVLLGSSCAMAEQMTGVWNLRFGMPREEVGPIMTEKNGAVRVTEYTYQPGYSEAMYLVNFFGREGTLLLRFSKRGLYMARFSFDRKDDKSLTAPPAPAPEPAPAPAPQGPRIIDGRTATSADGTSDMPLPPPPAEPDKPGKPEGRGMPPSNNFLHLKMMLTKKYGAPAYEVKDDGNVLGYGWKFVRNYSIVLFEDRFTPGNQAVLTYEAASLR